MSPQSTLAGVPLDRLGEWCQVQDEASPEARARALAEADALRVHSDADEDSWRCLSTYRALSDLALAGPLAIDRASFMVREDPGRDATTRAFAEAVVGRPGDVGIRAEILLAECDTHAGLDREAERRLRAIWPRVRGTASAAEVWTCNAMAEMFVVQRRELEALAIARRGEAATAAASDLEPVDVAQSRSSLARALFALGDTPRLLALLPTVLASAAAMGRTDAGRARFHMHLLVARSALRGGETEVARRHIASAEAEHVRDPGVIGHKGHAIASARARLAREERDALGLRRALEDIPPAASTDAVRVAARAGLEAAAFALAGDITAATLAARLCLGALCTSGSVPVSASLRIEEAEAVVRMALDHGLPAEIADAALRIAADAAFERLIELESAAKDLPTLGTPTDDDLQALGEYRSRFVRRHSVVLARLRDRIEASALDGSLSSWAQLGEAGLTTVCAWCLCVRDFDGAWLPLGHLLPSTPALPVTHGICARCRVVASRSEVERARGA